MRKFVTIRDVADKAGVSYSTVSLVLSNNASKYNLKPDTIKRVHDAAKALGYVRNASANLFRHGMKLNMIGFLVPSLDSTIYSDIFHGVGQVLSQEDHFLVVAGIGDKSEHEQDYIKEFLTYRFAGIICITNSFQEEHYQEIQRLNIPLIFVQTLPENSNCNYVSFDDRYGAYLAGKHLIEKGHKRIAYFQHGDESSDFVHTIHQHREEGLMQAVEEAGAEYTATKPVKKEDRAVEQWIQKHCQGNKRATGVFCCQDYTAAHLLRVATQMNVSIPQDLAVIGFDNLEICEYLFPRLTSIELPRLELGIEIGKTMMNLIKKSSRSKSAAPIHRLLKPKVVERETT